MNPLSIDTAIEGVTLYDGAGDKPTLSATVLISQGGIAYAGSSSKSPRYQAKATLPAKGMFLLPGLIDLHVHGLVSEDTLKSFLRNGVTTIRDLACPVFEALEWRAKENAGLIETPRLFFAGPVLTCEGGYPESVWGPKVSARVQGRYQSQEKVLKLAGMGIDVVKIGLEHELGPCLSDTEVAGVVSAAHTLGKRVTAHITDERDFELCVRNGVDEVAHIPSRPVSDDLWKEAVRTGMTILPTLHAHAGWAEEWRRKAEHPFGRFCRHGFEEGHHQCLYNMERFLALGGKTAYGTDAGNPHMPFGVSVKEWKDLQSAGVTPLQCLRMATSSAAKILGMEEKLGIVEKGKWADLALYAHDPLKNPENFRTLKIVWKEGEAYTAGNLEYPQPFDLDFWIKQWERTRFKPGWQETIRQK